MRQIILFCSYLFLAACSITQPAKAPPDTPALRVGVSPTYPPIVWERDGKLTGLEVDFAKALGLALNKPVEFKVLPWHDIFKALEDGNIDVIMSGVSITPERAKEYDFIQPYTTISQMAMIRMSDAARLGQPGTLHSKEVRIGYVKETTGENFVRSHLQGLPVGFLTSDLGVHALANGQIDYFIHDAPTVWHLANLDTQTSDRSQLLGLYHPLTKEQLAWAVSKNNEMLKAQIEAVYQTWRQNGTLEHILKKWLPTKILVE